MEQNIRHKNKFILALVIVISFVWDKVKFSDQGWLETHSVGQVVLILTAFLS